jgi:GTP 3',8-cyclase
MERKFDNLPARVALTNYCNLSCFFCSNEGMNPEYKNNCHADLDKLVFLLGAMRNGGFSKLSLTGGEPSCYPDVGQVLSVVKDLRFSQTFFHTNGIGLKENLSNELMANFTKVAVSVHSVNCDIWKGLTNGTDNQFESVMRNLNHLASISKTSQTVVEIKAVMIKGVNDSKKNLREVLDFCATRGFTFKLLNFEPITKDQEKYQLPLENVIKTITEFGAVPLEQDKEFRGQNSYMPINRFQYKGTKGVVIEIGCGQSQVCKACHLSNEVFISPLFEIKPCHVTDFTISLSDPIVNRDTEGVINAIVKSRDYLQESPGSGRNHWGD